VEKWEAMAVEAKAAYEIAMDEWRKKPPSSHSRYRLLLTFIIIFTSQCYARVALVADWLACCTQAQKGLGSNCRQTVHTHRASVHQAAKLVAALLRVTAGSAGLAESNGSLQPCL